MKRFWSISNGFIELMSRGGSWKRSGGWKSTSEGFRAALDDGVRFAVLSVERGLNDLLLAVGPSSSNDKQSSTAIKPIRRRVQISD